MGSGNYKSVGIKDEQDRIVGEKERDVITAEQQEEEELLAKSKLDKKNALRTKIKDASNLDNDL